MTFNPSIRRAGAAVALVAASVAAHSDCQLVVVDRRVLEQEVSSMKPWMGAFLRAFAARFRDLQSQRGRAAQQDPSALPWWRKWW